jgi:hypothetical protein
VLVGTGEVSKEGTLRVIARPPEQSEGSEAISVPVPLTLTGIASPAARWLAMTGLLPDT